jgi:tetratricopeptide (TPR) repeat protein
MHPAPQAAWGRVCSASIVARVLLALFLCLTLGLCLVPGFNLLNYYASLALALPGSLLAAWLGVHVSARLPNASEHGAARFVRAASGALALLAVPPIVLLANSLRVQNCDLSEGLAFYLAGAGASMLFASQVGAASSMVVRGRSAYVVATLIIVGWVGRDALLLYTEPAIYAYNPFVGFLSGAIYDDVIMLDLRYGLYRLFNGAQLLLLWAVALTLWDPESRRVEWSRLSSLDRRSGFRLAGALVVTVALGTMGAQFGLMPSRESIATTLGGELQSERVILHYDRERIGLAEAHRILDDHHFHLERLDQVLGETYSPVVRSFVYSSRSQKRRLMGARRVEVAKPWLREIHLTRPRFGASVVRHELAHVVLGRDAPGPLNLPAMAGIFPHAALVEGAAEALEWSSGDLTLHQWSAALRRLGLEVDIADLMGADGFYRQPPGKAYTLSGSFMRWLLETRGELPFRRVYADADFQHAYGEPLPTLVTAWRAFLDGLELPPGTEALAKQRFDRKAIFFRQCPLEIARLQVEVGRLLGEQRNAEALEVATRIVEFVPKEPNVRLRFVAVLAHLGRYEQARAEAERACADQAVNSVMCARFDALVADAAWRSGQATLAVTGYRAALQATLGDNSRRVTAIKLAIVSDPDREPILGPYLLGTKARGEVPEAIWIQETLDYLVAAVADLPGDPLALYLLGRRLAAEERHSAALGPLRTALGLLDKGDVGLPPEAARLVRDELMRIEGVALLASGYPEAAAQRFDALSLRSTWTGRSERYREWAERARWHRAVSLTR